MINRIICFLLGHGERRYNIYFDKWYCSRCDIIITKPPFKH